MYGNFAQQSPVTVNLVHALASILTPVSNTVVDIYAASLTGPTWLAEASEAAAVVQHAAASINARLLRNKKREREQQFIKSLGFI